MHRIVLWETNRTLVGTLVYMIIMGNIACQYRQSYSSMHNIWIFTSPEDSGAFIFDVESGFFFLNFCWKRSGVSNMVKELTKY